MAYDRDRHSDIGIKGEESYFRLQRNPFLNCRIQLESFLDFMRYDRFGPSTGNSRYLAGACDRFPNLWITDIPNITASCDFYREVFESVDLRITATSDDYRNVLRDEFGQVRITRAGEPKLAGWKKS